MKKKQLHYGDVVEVTDGFAKGKIGEVIPNDLEKPKPDTYKLDYGEGWCGWVHINNLKFLRRQLIL